MYSPRTLGKLIIFQVKELDSMATDFEASAKDGTCAKKGYLGSPYAMSKVFLSALSRIQQEEFDKHPEKDLVVNHLHPGYVDTDMSSHKGPMTIDEGAKASIYAGLLPPKTDIRGKYLWDNCAVYDWETHSIGF